MMETVRNYILIKIKNDPLRMLTLMCVALNAENRIVSI